MGVPLDGATPERAGSTHALRNMTNQREPQGDVPVETDSSVPETVRPEGENTQRMRRVIVEQTPEIVREVASSLPERKSLADTILSVAIVGCVCVWVSIGKASVAEAAGLIGGLLTAVQVIPAFINRRR